MRLDPKVALDLVQTAERVMEMHGLPGQAEWRDLHNAISSAKANDSVKNRPMMTHIHEQVNRANDALPPGFSYKLPHDPGGYGT